MSNALELARATLLDGPGLDEHSLSRVMDRILSRQVDAADIYFQYSRLESWVLEDGIVREGNHSIEQGAGLRAISGEKTGFAYTDDLVLPQLLEAAESARAIAHAGSSGSQAIRARTDTPRLYAPLNPLESLGEQEKLDLMRRLDAEARAADPRVQQVIVSLVAAHDTVLVIDNEGRLAGDVRPLARLNVNVIVEQDGRREQGNAGGGARRALDFFLEEDRATGYAREAVRQALVNLEAVPAPAGMLPVVLGPGWPGVLLHEAVGHGLEGDFNRKGTSAFSGRIGEQVASPLCTVVDDGSLPDRRGSLNIDDEGTPTQQTVLIEKGVLKGYMQDRMNARLMGMQPTGNGRRESYAHLPMPRMTNTYMLAGEHDPGEIITSVDRGLYAVNFGGGQVDITSGKFVFSASEAYLIENGKVTAPVKGATLIGSGPEAMTRISMVGNDLQLDSGIGICGKEGQSVPVGVGQPTLKIDEMTIGGDRRMSQYDLPQLQGIVAELLDEAKKQGASQAEAGVHAQQGLDVTVRLGETETIEHTNDHGLGVTVYFGHRKGSANTTDLRPAAIRETVAAACRIARHTEEDPAAGLADAERMAREVPDLDLDHPWAIDAEEAAAIARECEDAARGFDPRIDNSEGASVHTQNSLFVYGNTHGFVGGYPTTRHSLSCAVLASEGDEMQRDYWYSSSRLPGELESPVAVGQEAARRTVARLGSRKLATTQCPVIFKADVATTLLRALFGAIRGPALYRQASFLLDSLGEPVFPDWVNICENPLKPRGLASAPFDNEGVATRANSIIESGVLRTYLLDSYSARKLGMRTTGHAGGVRNVRIDNTGETMEQLMDRMQSGLIVTELMGQGSNLVTGDYSRGAAGFWVEDGQIAYPVSEITIAGNLRDMFDGLLAVGGDNDIPGSIDTGSWLIERMTVAGQ